MGLEAINFFFRSDEPIKGLLLSEFTHADDRKYMYTEDNNYWIDIEIQDAYSVSIRITLCNPLKPVLKALHQLLTYLFRLKNGVLIDLNTKQSYRTYNDLIRIDIEGSYLNKKKRFENIYGNFVAAIGSEEFYKRLDESND